MRLLLIIFFLSLFYITDAQTLNWQPQGNVEVQRIRAARFMGAPIRDTVGGVGFTDKDSVGAILQHPNGTFYIKDKYGWQAYYNRTESDNRYVINPSGKITASWIQAWDYAISADAPNLANIDLKYLIVNAAAGDTAFTVIGGTGMGDFTPNFAAVAFDKAGNHYNTFFVYRQDGSTYHTDRPFKYNLTADTIKFMWSSYQGQHMTDYGYRGYADRIYDHFKSQAQKDYKLYSFYPEDNPSVIPFTAINGAVQGGLIPSTSIPQLFSITTATINYSQRATMYLAIQQGGAADRGGEWQVNLGKKSGYLEVWVGVNKTLPGFAKVLFYLDGVLKKTDTVRGAVQRLTYDFSNASSGKIQVVTGDTQPTNIRVGTTVWYQTAVDPTTKGYTGGKIMFVGDSWTQHWFNGGVFYKSSPERFRARWVADGGDPTDIINVGRGGMTSAWGKYFFKYWLNLYKPKYVYVEFYINDSNSSSFVGVPSETTWNFNSTDPYAPGTDVDGKVTQQQWLDNYKYMKDTAIAYGVTPFMLMNTPTGSLTQTQGQSAWFSALRPASQYYDIETIFTSAVYADASISAPLINSPRGVVDTTDTRLTRGGAASISGSYLMELQQLNSATAKGLIIYPKVNFTGSLGKLLSVQNVPTIGSGEVFSVANNGLTTSAVGFSAGANGYVIPPFSITYNSTIARISATNSTTVQDLYVGDSLTGVVRMRIPMVVSNYSTAALPSTAIRRVKGALAFDSDLNKFAGTDGTSWWYFGREDSTLARFDSTRAKLRFIQNSLNFSAQAANIWTAGTVRFDFGSDAKWDMFYRDSATGRITRLPAGVFGQNLSAGPGGKPEWTTPPIIGRVVSTATDANYVIPNNTDIAILPVITANRTVTLPSLSAGQMLIIHNRNSAAFNWSFTNGNVRDAAGNTITNLVNQSVYQFYYDGTNVYKIN